MLRVRTYSSTHALGLGQVPSAIQAIQDIKRSMSGRCFTSDQLLKLVQKSQAFAESLNPQTSTFTDSYNPTAARAAMSKRWWDLDYWRGRLSNEATATYCAGSKNGAASQDLNLISDAITGPYIEAAGIAGSEKVTAQALAELKTDLINNTVNVASSLYNAAASLVPTLPNFTSGMQIAGLAIAGVIAYGLFERVRGSHADSHSAP